MLTRHLSLSLYHLDTSPVHRKRIRTIVPRLQAIHGVILARYSIKMLLQKIAVLKNLTRAIKLGYYLCK